MGYSPGNETQRKLIIPILRIFISLCSTPQFHWHLSKYNALDLLIRIREKDDDYISDVAKEVCEKVIDHSHEGQINNPLNPSGGVTGGAGGPTAGGDGANAGSLGSVVHQPPVGGAGGAGALGANNDSMTAEYDVQLEINTISNEENLQVVKNCVINMEKNLIQKKLKLDKFNNEELTKLVKFFEKILK